MTAPARTPLRRSLRALAVLVAVVLGLGTAGPALADPADRLTFGIGPADGGRADDGRALFVYGLTPGAVAYDRAAVVNHAAQPQTFEVSAQDAVNASDGSVAVTDPSTPSAEVGRWIRLQGPAKVTVPGRGRDGRPGRVVIPFTVSVPSDAEPGDHAGAVVVALTVKGKDSAGASVDLVQRVAARAYVRVSGATRPELVVNRLEARWQAPTWPWQQGHLDVDYAVQNTGNIRMGVQPSLRVHGLLTGARSVSLDSTPELLPNGELTGSTTLAGLWPTGPVTVELVATPRAGVALAAPDLEPVSRSTQVWALAWWLLAALVLLLLAATALVLRIRRRSLRDRSATAASRHGAGTESLRERLVGIR